MKKKINLNKIKNESYSRIVLDNNYIKLKDIVKLHMSIDINIAYSKYQHQS